MPVENGSISETEYVMVDAEWAVTIASQVIDIVILTLAVTGVVLNCLVFIAWRNCSCLNKSLAVLFKALAVADIVFMFSFTVWNNLSEDSDIKFVLKLITFTSRNAVVNITFFMSWIRWATVVFPYTFRPDMFDDHASMTLGIIVTYCAVAELLRNLLTKYQPFSRKTVIYIDVAISKIVLSFPVLVQALLSAHLLRTMHKLDKKMAHTAGGKNKTKVSNRRLSSVVVSITLVTFLSYPVGIMVSTFFKLMPTSRSLSSKKLIFSCVHLMNIFNSATTFFIYWAFMPQFRRSLARQLPCCPKRIGIKKHSSTTHYTKERSHLFGLVDLLSSTTVDSDVDHTASEPSSTFILEVNLECNPSVQILNSTSNTTVTSDCDPTRSEPYSTIKTAVTSDCEPTPTEPHSTIKTADISDCEPTPTEPHSTIKIAVTSDCEPTPTEPHSTI